MASENDTFDNKRLVQPVDLHAVDEAFYTWWNNKLNCHITSNDKTTKKKVPVRFVNPERWKTAREIETRDENGTLVLPIIAITRTETASPSDGAMARQFADNKDLYTYAKLADKKSSIVKNLLKERPSSIDPDLPIYELYTIPVPDHYSLTYEVSIRVSYQQDMNEIIEKIGQELDFKSKKSFQFSTEDGYYFIAFQDDLLSDESNIGDFTGDERLIEKTYVFEVPAYIISNSNERRPQFKRFFSQTKLVFREEEKSLTEEELDALLSK